MAVFFEHQWPFDDTSIVPTYGCLCQHQRPFDVVPHGCLCQHQRPLDFVLTYGCLCQHHIKDPLMLCQHMDVFCQHQRPFDVVPTYGCLLSTSKALWCCLDSAQQMAVFGCVYHHYLRQDNDLPLFPLSCWLPACRLENPEIHSKNKSFYVSSRYPK